MSNFISREELAARIEAGNVTVVEALPAMYYLDAHLPGAWNLPHDQVEALAPSLLPDKQAAIVVYCANTACQNSGLAVRRLERLSYTNVLDYEEGKQGWVEAGLPTEAGEPAAAGSL